jgi:Flp pilus assembly pilin Flp
MMLRLYLLAQRLRREEGQGIIEYALLASLISVVSIVFLTWVGFDVTEVFDKVENALGGSDTSSPTAPSV